MNKRAVIYVRVSTERQADRVSPETQEADCRKYCETQGYQVIKVYRDIEKYRLGGRMVEPSGARSDRPQLRQMLSDGDAGLFDVLVAWREDRLYRGINRAMLAITEHVKQKVFQVELAKGYYDATMAGGMAWAAGIELDAKRDRFNMGIHGRLAQGKNWCSVPPYGYKTVDGQFVIDDYEAEWVRNIWRWYGSGVDMHIIRQKLIEEGLPQRRKNRKYDWERSIIRKILAGEFYYTGIFKVKWDGKNYETPIPPILDDVTFQMVKERLSEHKAYPATNLKTHALAAGKVWCAACRVRMGVVTTTAKGKKYFYYRCHNSSHQMNKSGCAHSYIMQDFDRELWSKIGELILTPGIFEKAVNDRIDRIRAEETDAEGECDKLQREVDNIGFERNKVVTWARKEIITEDDLKVQLAVLAIQENETRRALAEVKLLTGGRAERMEELIKIFREKTQRGISILEAEPDTPERADKQFQARRKIVQEIVAKVEVQPDKSMKIYTEIDLPGLLSTSDKPF